MTLATSTVSASGPYLTPEGTPRPTPTLASTPTPVPQAPPQLVSPAPGTFSAGPTVVLSWALPGGLAVGEHFWVRVTCSVRGESREATYWASSSSLSLGEQELYQRGMLPADGDRFQWSVWVKDSRTGASVREGSSSSSFVWQPPLARPTPTATATPPRPTATPTAVSRPPDDGDDGPTGPPPPPPPPPPPEDKPVR